MSTDQNGIQLKRTGGLGFGPSELVEPVDIIWKGMLLYILDRGAKSVKLYDRMLNFRGENKLSDVFPSSQVSDPGAMSVNNFGEIFITDRLSHTILAADQNLRERGDVFFVENLPGKKLQFPIVIFSDGDFIAVRDSNGLFLFDRYLNFLNFTELKKSQSLSGILKEYIFLAESDSIMVSKSENPGLPLTKLLIERSQNSALNSLKMINNRLWYITGKKIFSVNTNQLLNEQ